MILNAFQLRAGRSAISIGVREIGNIINVNRTTVSIWENRNNFEKIGATINQNDNLLIFFKERNIFFLGENSIELNISKNQRKSLSRFQIRTARVAMNMTQNELSLKSGVSQALINYLESKENDSYICDTPKSIDEKGLRIFFENNGISFPHDFCIKLDKDPREIINNY